MISFSQLPEITGGRYIQFYQDSVIEHLIIDSRKASAQAGSVFFAIKGIRHDGHDYIADIYRLGTRQFVVEEPVSKLTDFPEANFLLVASAVNALQDIAAYHRNSFSIPVIGVTGSNGKTIVKEWLFQMMSKDQTVVKNPGSFNSQVGVPLSVWQMQSHHQLGIFEAGISSPGEMERLERVIQPSIGVFTNIGSAHDEGFSGRDEKIEEKLKLFKKTQVVIYRADQTAVKTIVEKLGLNTFSWGKKEGADVSATAEGDRCNVIHGAQSYTFRMPSPNTKWAVWIIS